MTKLIVAFDNCANAPNHRNKTLNIKSAFRFSLQFLSEKFFILRRTELNMIIDIYLYSSSSKVPVILVQY
jgi:hypothetical protein